MNTHDASQNTVDTADALFDLGEMEAVSRPGSQGAAAGAAPRLRLAERHQGEFRLVVLDQLLPADHQVRMVWDYVYSLDLSPLLARVRAVEGKPGRDITDPRILLCLWLYATLEGIGSARELDRLCSEHLAFMWICGGVTVNYHLLADFRGNHVEFLDRLLTQGVAALRCEGLVDLECVAQDGLRVRASAGASSFRRRNKLEAYLKEAEVQVERLRAELHREPAVRKSQQAAKERAARERVQRLQQALQELEKIEAARETRKKGSKDQARASSTDPEARKTKMPDGGFRPAYNAQLATDTSSRIIVGVDVTNAVSDGGQMGPMLDEIKERHGKLPKEYLVDGGFTSRDDITYAATEHKVTVYAPIKDTRKKQQQGKDPFTPQKGDSPAVQEWRRRMGTEYAQALYRLRAATAEWTNAQARNRGLYQVTVRGLQKVKAVLLLYALVHNLMQTQVLLAAKQAAEM